MIFIFVIFYFLLIAPMRKKQKKTQEMLSKLKKGDEVITGGGIFGRITALDEERGFVILQISDNTKIKVLRSGDRPASPANPKQLQHDSDLDGTAVRARSSAALLGLVGAAPSAELETRHSSCTLRRSFLWEEIWGRSFAGASC